MNLTLMPSATYFSVFLMRAIATHPLIINPIVTDPITSLPISISKYRLRSGLYVGSGVVCSIYPYGSDSTSPTSTSVSSLYKAHSLGHDYTESIHHFTIEFGVNAVNVNGFNKLEDSLLTDVPSLAIQQPEEEILYTNSGISSIELEINPSMFLLWDYLELTRLVLSDQEHRLSLEEVGAPSIRNFEIIHSNINPIPWEKKTEAYFHTGTLLVRFQSYLANTWKGNFTTNVNTFNLTTSLTQE